MRIDLNDVNFFKYDMLLLDKNINIIFGKNGTGKSTITELIRKQKKEDFDIRIFQGFESVIGEDEKLNAVLLGEENKRINEQIKQIESEINNISDNISELESMITKSENDKENLFSEYKNIEDSKARKEREISTFYSNSARTIANNIELVQNARKYNKNNFENEIPNAKLLDAQEIEKYRNILKSEQKQASHILFPKIALDKLLDSVNDVLKTKVKARIVLEELNDDSQKIEFAQKGMKIHKAGEKCAFCGNVIKSERMQTLSEYFSADEVMNLQDRIAEEKKKIIVTMKTIEELKVKEDEFYPDFVESVKAIKDDIQTLINSYKSFLETLLKNLDEKERKLFEEMKILTLEVPQNFDEIKKKYEELVHENNLFSKNLKENQEKARKLLRYHEIYKLIDNFKLEVKFAELKAIGESLDKVKEKIESIRGEISKKETEKKEKLQQIETLLQKTQSTKLLADNINKKLNIYVSFELIRREIDQQEFYEVKGLDGEIRKITELSTGEKNIIAFLYFVEKLNEIRENVENKNRIIIFDDPMNSNDDTMQYLIMSELEKLMKKCQKDNSSDKFILLTHNVFFYLNVTHDIKRQRDGKNPYEKYNFYKLLTNNKYTRIIKINNNNQDFKTNYQALWYELAFLYEEDKPKLMLNPIRRIIETYVIFNGVNDFYKDNREAKMLFNVNSHYVPDIEADLNGKTKDDIIELMKECFNNNNGTSHFNKHWKYARKVIKD